LLFESLYLIGELFSFKSITQIQKRNRKERKEKSQGTQSFTQ